MVLAMPVVKIARAKYCAMYDSRSIKPLRWLNFINFENDNPVKKRQDTPLHGDDKLTENSSKDSAQDNLICIMKPHKESVGACRSDRKDQLTQPANKEPFTNRRSG
jgi:hypothetical protein